MGCWLARRVGSFEVSAQIARPCCARGWMPRCWGRPWRKKSKTGASKFAKNPLVRTNWLDLSRDLIRIEPD